MTTKHRSFSCTRSRHRFCAFFARLSSFGTTGFQEGSWEHLGGVHLRKVGWEGESSMVFGIKNPGFEISMWPNVGILFKFFKTYIIYSSRADWRVDLHDTHLNRWGIDLHETHDNIGKFFASCTVDANFSFNFLDASTSKYAKGSTWDWHIRNGQEWQRMAKSVSWSCGCHNGPDFFLNHL